MPCSSTQAVQLHIQAHIDHNQTNVDVEDRRLDSENGGNGKRAMTSIIQLQNTRRKMQTLVRRYKRGEPFKGQWRSRRTYIGEIEMRSNFVTVNRICDHNENNPITTNQAQVIGRVFMRGMGPRRCGGWIWIALRGLRLLSFLL